MSIAAIILSTLSLIMSISSLVFLLVKHFSTHQIEVIDSAKLNEMAKQDEKLNEKLVDSQNDNNWI